MTVLFQAFHRQSGSSTVARGASPLQGRRGVVNREARHPPTPNADSRSTDPPSGCEKGSRSSAMQLLAPAATKRPNLLVSDEKHGNGAPEEDCRECAVDTHNQIFLPDCRRPA